MAYASISDMRLEGFKSSRYSDSRVQTALTLAQRMVDRATKRFFEPRDLTFTETWNGRDFLLLNHPIIRVDSVRFINTDGTLQDPLEDDDIEVYNRHVRQGLTNKDDRDSPKIAMLFVRPTTIHPRTKPSTVQEIIRNRLQNVQVVGKFGYTDPDHEAGRTIASNGSDSITAPDQIHIENGAFTDEDVGRTITIQGSASNDAVKTIAEVVGPKDIKTVEQDLVTEGSGFTADVSAFPQFGVTPLEIKQATILLASRNLDPLATKDPVQDAIKAGRIRRMAVRDQSISLDSDPRLTSQGGDSLTGYPDVDQLLVPFIRPPRMAAV